MEAVLRSEGFQPILAENGEQALTVGDVTLNYDMLTVSRVNELITLPKKNFTFFTSC